MRITIIAVVLLGLVSTAFAGEDLSKYAVWITGEVYADKGVLLFRADKAVDGNSAGNVVLLGATKDTVKVLLPLYTLAAEKHATLRLKGVLFPVPGKPAAGAPSVEFITYKLHSPDDPDDLAADKKIIIHDGDSVQVVPSPSK